MSLCAYVKSTVILSVEAVSVVMFGGFFGLKIVFNLDENSFRSRKRSTATIDFATKSLGLESRQYR